MPACLPPARAQLVHGFKGQPWGGFWLAAPIRLGCSQLEPDLAVLLLLLQFMPGVLHGCRRRLPDMLDDSIAAARCA
jgi:hypothetical protein